VREAKEVLSLQTLGDNGIEMLFNLFRIKFYHS
jgi:hypothetical protein